MQQTEPSLHPSNLKKLRPTQMTAGYREVEMKRREWRHTVAKQRGDQFLGSHAIPVILGPKKREFVIDHHHLGLSLIKEGQTDVLTHVEADLSHLNGNDFWFVMDHRGWCSPYDQNGHRCAFDDMPKSLTELKDDPYRSLAGELRRAGGYAKDLTPFSEFLWANYLRNQVSKKQLEKDFDEAVKEALAIARQRSAQYLPGWCGPSS